MGLAVCMEANKKWLCLTEIGNCVINKQPSKESLFPSSCINYLGTLLGMRMWQKLSAGNQTLFEDTQKQLALQLPMIWRCKELNLYCSKVFWKLQFRCALLGHEPSRKPKLCSPTAGQLGAQCHCEDCHVKSMNQKSDIKIMILSNSISK